MAKISVTLSGTVTTEAAVGLPDETRFLAWVAATYPADTLSEQLALWWEATMAGTAANVERFERTVEAEKAVATVRAMLTPPVWRAGLRVSVGERYFHEGRIYIVLQAHTTQSDWAPPVVAALWRVET